MRSVCVGGSRNKLSCLAQENPIRATFRDDSTFHYDLALIYLIDVITFWVCAFCIFKSFDGVRDLKAKEVTVIVCRKQRLEYNYNSTKRDKLRAGGTPRQKAEVTALTSERERQVCNIERNKREDKRETDRQILCTTKITQDTPERKTRARINTRCKDHSANKAEQK